MSEHDVFVMTRDGNERHICAVPDTAHAADVVAAEMQRACQKAYDLGRCHEREAVKIAIDAALALTFPEGRS